MKIDMSAYAQDALDVIRLKDLMASLPGMMEDLTEACQNAGFDLPESPTLNDLIALEAKSAFFSALLVGIVKKIFGSQV